MQDDRSSVLALFYFAIPVGTGLGYIVGSQVAGAAGDWRSVSNLIDPFPRLRGTLPSGRIGSV